MTILKAIQILQALVHGNADCRCGNFEINEETIEAIEKLIFVVENPRCKTD